MFGGSGREILGEPRRGARGKTISRAAELLRSPLEHRPPTPFKKASKKPFWEQVAGKHLPAHGKEGSCPGAGESRGAAIRARGFTKHPAAPSTGAPEMLPQPQHPSPHPDPRRGLPKAQRRTPGGTKLLPGGGRGTGELSAAGGTTAPSTALVAPGSPTARCDGGRNASNVAPQPDAGPGGRKEGAPKTRGTEGSEALADVRIYHIFVCVTIH